MIIPAISWNVRTSNKAGSVRAGVAALLAKKPVVLGLQECYHHYSSLTGHDGYSLVQLVAQPDQDGVMNEDANVAVLVSDEWEITHHRVFRMKQRWTGPKQGIEHEPRVWHALWLKPKAGGRTVKVGIGHAPTGGPHGHNAAAWHEFMDSVVRFLNRTIPGRLAFFVGDLNADKKDVDVVAAQVKHGGRVGAGVDHAIYRLAKASQAPESTPKQPKFFDSDHNARRFSFTRTPAQPKPPTKPKIPAMGKAALRYLYVGRRVSVGWCLLYVHDALGIPARDGKAYQTWDDAPAAARITDRSKFVPGYPLVWRDPAGKRAGHIALLEAWPENNGATLTVRSTDWPISGEVGNGDVDAISHAWELELCGQITELNGVPIR